jgi:hypothetical protein
LICTKFREFVQFSSSGYWLLHLNFYCFYSEVTGDIGIEPATLEYQAITLTRSIKKSVSIITTNHLKTGIVPNSETLCKSNMPLTNGNTQHNIDKMNRPLAQSFKESGLLSFIEDIRRQCGHDICIFTINVFPLLSVTTKQVQKGHVTYTSTN